MNNRFKYIVFVALSFVALFLLSCNDQDVIDNIGDGTLELNFSITDQIVVSKSGETASQSSIVKIYNEEGLIRKYEGLDNIPSSIPLLSGSYSVKVEVGDSVAASFTSILYNGSESFEVTKGNTSSVSIECEISNVVVSVELDESLNTVFSDYQTLVRSATGELIFNSSTEANKGYFLLDKGESRLHYSFTATTLGGESYTKEEYFDVEPTTLYTLQFSHTEITAPSTGGGLVDIVINGTPLVENTNDLTLFQAPIIKGYGFNIKEIQTVATNTDKEININMGASSTFTSVTFTSSSLIGWGFSAEMVDILTLTIDELAALGLSVNRKPNTETGQETISLRFNNTLMQKISATEGQYSIEIKAIDSKDLEKEETFTIWALDAVAVTDAVDRIDVFTTRATLKGRLISATEDAVSFRYKVSGSSNWQTVSPIMTGLNAEAEISGLTAATTYEVQIVVGDIVNSNIVTFITEAKAQFPNSSFEDWSGTSPLLIYGDGGSMFWDSGNHGSATLSKNVTEPDGALFNSGSKSVRMKSQFVGVSIFGKFAAGNMFVGKYLATDGTDGILGWGRSFNSRPKALRGYVKYNSGTVDYSETELIAKGDNDQGIIYIALGDWTGSSYNEETWPLIVKTKTEEFFDPNAAGVIAYGEQVYTESTSGEVMIEFTINLDYKVLDRVPTSIIVVSSASRYGDYFSGSTSSTMWLDDLELIYE